MDWFSKFTSVSQEQYNEFGRSIDIHDKYLIVGEPYASDLASNSSAIYIYYYDTSNGTWTQDALKIVGRKFRRSIW